MPKSSKKKTPKKNNVNSSKMDSSKNFSDNASTSSNAENSLLASNSQVESTSNALNNFSSALESFKAKCLSDNEECASMIRLEVQRALTDHFSSVSSLASKNNQRSAYKPSEETFIDDSFRQMSESILHMVDQELHKHKVMFDSKWNEFSRNLDSLTKSVSQLELDLDELNQYGRRSCLILYGLPFKEREDLLKDIPQFFSEKLNIHFSSKDLVAVHRLPQSKRSFNNNSSTSSRLSSTKPAPVIIKFVHMDVRNQIYFNKKKLKNTPFSISENLTKRRTELLKTVRDLHFISWTFNGTIFVMDANDRRRKISTLEDLQKHAKNLKKFQR